jgi:hypothetical protein
LQGFGRRLPPLDPANLNNLRADQLRAAIRSNLVTFPGQIPVFERHDRPDLQRRIVLLYFTFGWSCATIAGRYGMLRQRVGQVLNTWKRRALETGYIQYIPPPENKPVSNPTIRVALSAVVCDSDASVAVAAAGVTGVSGSSEPAIYPVSRKDDRASIFEVLNQFAAGKTATEVAMELSLPEQTVLAWKREYWDLTKDKAELPCIRLKNAGQNNRE